MTDKKTIKPGICLGKVQWVWLRKAFVPKPELGNEGDSHAFL